MISTGLKPQNTTINHGSFGPTRRGSGYTTPNQLVDCVCAPRQRNEELLNNPSWQRCLDMGKMGT